MCKNCLFALARSILRHARLVLICDNGVKEEPTVPVPYIFRVWSIFAKSEPLNLRLLACPIIV